MVNDRIPNLLNIMQMNQQDKSLDERLAQATDLRKRGYNCAQTVALCFSDVCGLDADALSAATMGLGGGVGGTGEICGVVSAMSVVEGCAAGPDPSRKAAVYKNVKEDAAAFAARNGGCVRCRDLKRPGAARPCDALIADGIEILHARYCADRS